MKKITVLGFVFTLFVFNSCQKAVPQLPIEQKTWREGIVTDEFIFEEAPYPSCHAATIVETTDGTLIASWFGGTKERHPDVGIWVSRQVNGVWSEAVEVVNGVVDDTLRYPTWNPVLFQIPGGDLLLFYKVGPSPSTWKGMCLRSSDKGLTWSSPVALGDGFVGPVKNKPVLLKDGTILAPSSVEGNGWHLQFESSKDQGQSWVKTDTISRGKGEIDAIQPSVLVHKGGKLQAIGRTKNRALFSTWSKDSGKSWSELELLEMPNNNSGTDAVTLSDGSFALVYNHVLPHGDKAKGLRTPLNLSVSKDGIHWNAALVLENSGISQYSYPSIIQSKDGMLHIVYTWRRQRIKHVVVDPAKLITYPIEKGVWPGEKEQLYKVAVCDWMILKRQKLSAFTLASEINSDGIELDMGGLGNRETFNSKLGDSIERQKFLDASKEKKVGISSIAMSGFYAQSFATRDTYQKMVGDCIQTMKNMGVEVAYLPLGTQGDLVKNPELRSAIVERLQWAAKEVGKIGGVIAIETSLDAAGDKQLLEEIGSPNIKISFNFANAIDNGRDLIQEIKTLGGDRIAQFHASNTDAVWIENDKAIDMPAIKQLLDDMRWKGWLIVERSRDTTQVRNVKANFGANVAYLKNVLQK